MHLSLSSAVSLAVVILCCCGGGVSGLSFVLPGIKPVDHSDGDAVPVAVGALRSLQEVMPYDYYSLPFMRPSTPVRNRVASLGEVLQGDRLQTSPYAPNMLHDGRCKLLEAADSPRTEENQAEVREHVDRLEMFINQGYRASLVVDGLDAWESGDYGGSTRQCIGQVPLEQRFQNQRGYALGVHHDCLGKTLIHNHLQLRFDLQRVMTTTSGTPTPQFRVMGFTVKPFSIRHRDDGSDCSENSLFDPERLDIVPLTVDDVRSGSTRLLWSYGVTWVERPGVTWMTRWDAYLLSSETNNGANVSIHWFSLANGALCVVLLCAMLTMILMSTVVRCDGNNRRVSIASTNDEVVEWSATKAADEMLRPPSHHVVLASLVGNGLQLLAAYTLLLCSALLGFLSPDNRGGLVSCGIVGYVVCAPVGSCATFGLLRQKSNANLRRNVLLCSGLFPALVCLLFFTTNCIHQSYGASNAVPWPLAVKVISSFAAIGAGLTLAAATVAARKPQYFFALPDDVARAFSSSDGAIGPEASSSSKKPPWYLRAWFAATVPPLVPFGVVFIEIFFVSSALWQGRVYYVFGFLAAASLLWVIAVASTAVIFTFCSLQRECTRWWWMSFASGTGFGLHWMLYSWYFFAARLHITSPASIVLYGIYSTGLALSYGIAGGAVGVTASWLFVKALYIKRAVIQPPVEMKSIVTSVECDVKVTL